MTETAPPWLLTMRAITGLTETSGSGNNSKILAMADTIAAAYPEMQAYCDLYTADSIAWCGLCAAYCMAVAGIRPVFGPTDTDRFLWAQAWDDPDWGYNLGVPRPGCVVVMSRDGGGHVTFYERTEGSSYVCRGGNQSDHVNQQSYAISSVTALLWPLEAGEPPPAPKRTLKQGDEGSDVEYLQDALGLPADGAFGPVTTSGVKGFQVATGLAADGVCGPATWARIDDLVRRNDTGTDGLDDGLVQTIGEIALTHPLQHYNWDDRGSSPPGYVSGMGQAFALAVLRYLNNDPAVIGMAQVEGPSTDDALSWYGVEFDKLGMSNAQPGIETLRHLFVLMIGLGMRETSGRYCEGRDITASNTSSETCEAGLFQTSWNIKSASPNIPSLLEEFWADPNGFLDTFAEGVAPTVDNLDNYGTGQGASYQFLAKYSPCFAVFVTAIGLRTRLTHWGPVSRREVELVPEADYFLKQIEILVRELPQEPLQPLGPDDDPDDELDDELDDEAQAEPAVVTITTEGNVVVMVDGIMFSQPKP